MSVKFTVIIPTRERVDTLLHCLRTIVAQDYADLTIIVSDNFSQDNTREVVASFSDSRIQYINPGKRMSMTHHWEFALSHVTTGWVMIVGDDDGLLPGALTKIAQIISHTGCSALISDVCRYDWPNNLCKDGTVVVPLNKGFEWRDSRVWLDKVMRGDAYYMDLPCLYTGGVVDSGIVNRIRGLRGDFYFSMTPDIYSGIAVASSLDRYVMLKEPIAVAGRSSKSMAAAGAGFANSASILQQFLLDDNIPFDSRLREENFNKSLEIVIYECYLQTQYIHHDCLNLKIEDQLGLALSRCDRDRYNVLRQYCVEIAKRNGVDISKVKNKEIEYGKWQFFKKLKERIYRSFHYRVLSGYEFGVSDVYGASILANAIFLLETRYAGWRFKKFLQGLRKLGLV